MDPQRQPWLDRHVLVVDQAEPEGDAWALLCAAQAGGARLLAAARDEPARQRLSAPAAQAGIGLLQATGDGALGLSRVLHEALPRLAPRLDLVALVLPPAEPPSAMAQAHVQDAAEDFLQALQSDCLRLAELAHRCEPHLGPGSRLWVLAPAPAATDVMAIPGLREAREAALASTVRYLARSLQPQGVRVALRRPPATRLAPGRGGWFSAARRRMALNGPPPPPRWSGGSDWRDSGLASAHGL